MTTADTDRKTIYAGDIEGPFPYFGGKSRIAPIVWERLGNVQHYVEPFFGSGAVLLNRPHNPKLETVNDIDCFLINFWRAVKNDPEAVSKNADYPVSELDMHARSDWLFGQRDELKARFQEDKDYFCPVMAGVWVWGVSACIGDSFQKGRRALPHLSAHGMGVHRLRENRLEYIQAMMHVLSHRLGNVRITCGDWSRLCTGSLFKNFRVSGVFLDPPYGDGEKRLYMGSNDSDDIAQDVAEWCRKNGDNPKLRIALCGYEEVIDMPDSWECYQWMAHGGYSNSGTNNNKMRERIWFSPHCLKKQIGLFE